MLSRESSGLAAALLLFLSLLQPPSWAQSSTERRLPSSSPAPENTNREQGQAADLGQPLETGIELETDRQPQQAVEGSTGPLPSPSAEPNPATPDLDPFKPQRNRGVDLFRIDTL